jgi:hypothetical protein
MSNILGENKGGFLEFKGGGGAYKLGSICHLLKHKQKQRCKLMYNKNSDKRVLWKLAFILIHFAKQKPGAF